MTLLAQEQVIALPHGKLHRRAGDKTERRSLFSLTVAADLLAAYEAITIFVAGLGAKVAYLDIYLGTSQPISPFASLGLLASLISFFIIRSLNLYELRIGLRVSLRLRLLMLALGAAFLILVAVLYMLKIGDNFSRGWVLLWFGFSAGGLAAGRVWTHKFLRGRAAEGWFRPRVAIYGAGSLGQHISSHILEHQDDFELVGLFDDEAPSGDVKGGRDGAGIDALIALGQENMCDQVIVALPLSEKTRICNLVTQLSVLPADIQLFPEVISLPVKIRGATFIGELHVLDLQRRPLTERGWALKCSMDYLFSGSALVVLMPLFVLVAIAIKLDSRGPVFFRQRRHGFNHRVIRVFKFRTMTVLEDGDVIRQAAQSDQRVTTVGRFLRRTSIDELPQLINVLRGEMSLVGPRPHALAHNEYYRDLVEHYSARHRVRPGITGWAQVHGYRGETRSSDHMRNRIQYDLHYIDNWSLLLDLKIMFKTLGSVFSSKNAY